MQARPKNRPLWLASALILCTGAVCAPDTGDAPVAATATATIDEKTVSQAREPVGRALIVAISRYGQPPRDFPNVGDNLLGYSTIHSTNDTLLMRGALRGFGFQDENVRVLSDQDADAEGIRAAFRDLVEASQPGDMVVFHYSGHGHQIADDDMPLEETDGYDELLVPYGAPAEFRPGYDGSLHIRDDEVGEFLDALRARVAPDGIVTFFLDSCFSGTGTRGADELPTRGSNVGLGPRAEGPVALVSDSIGFGPEAGQQSGLADYVFISAASNRQLAREVMLEADASTNQESMIVGPLSYALANSLPRLAPGGTYRDLYVLIKQALNGKVVLSVQMPQIEGNIDNVVFSTAKRRMGRFVSVESLLSDGRVVVAGGTLMGLGRGSRLEFYPLSVDSAGQTQPVAKGEVTSAGPIRSWVRLDEPASEDLMATRAFPVSFAYAYVTRVKLEDSLQPSDRENLLTGLEQMPLVKVVDEGPDLLITDSRGLKVRNVSTGRDVALGSPTATVSTFARNQFLRQLSLDDPSIEVDFELVPATREGDTCPTRPDWDREPDPGKKIGERTWRLAYDEGFYLRITSRTARRLYVTIVDLMPDGDLWVLFPENTPALELSQDRPFEIRDCFLLDDVLGNETLKLFVTDEQVDLSASFGIRTRNLGSRGGNLTALEGLMDSVVGQTRAGRSMPSGSGRTYDIYIDVVEPGSAQPGNNDSR